MKASIHLFIEIESRPWDKVVGLSKQLDRAAQATMARLPKSLLPLNGRCNATLLLTSDKVVRDLNRDYRGKDKPTNVLSFPQLEPEELKKTVRGIGKIAGHLPLGDIAVAYRYVVEEAKAENKKLKDHVSHLLIHGLLHLLGYDHMTPAQAGRMESLERLIMSDLGLADPYAPMDVGAPCNKNGKRKK